MTIRVWTQRYMRDLQRLHLAQRLIALGARTQVIVQWTGLSTVQARSLWHQCGMDLKNTIPVRLRGPQPSSLEPLMRSERWRNEASGFIGICSTLGALPPTLVKNPKKELPTLARGEQLCHAYEIYRSMAPGQCLDFDRAFLVFSAVAQGTEIKAIPCEGCTAVILVEARNCGRRHCVFCAEEAEQALRVDPSSTAGWYRHPGSREPAIGGSKSATRSVPSAAEEADQEIVETDEKGKAH